MIKSLIFACGLAIGCLMTVILPDLPCDSEDKKIAFKNLVPCRPGPWGEVYKRDVHIGLLDDEGSFWGGPQGPQAPSPTFAPSWVFPGYDEDRLRELFSRTDLDQASMKELFAFSTFDSAACVLMPSTELILNLSPTTRRILYEELAKYHQNKMQFTGYRWTIERFETGMGDLQQSTANLLRRLSYDIDGYRYFCDTGVLLSRIPDAIERRRVLIALMPSSCMVVRLRLDAGSDIDALSRYWGRGRDNISMFLRSRSRDVEGSLIDIVHLLPDVPRNLLYRYSIFEGKGHDCMWTSFNFMNEMVDERLSIEAYRKPYFRQNYHYVDVGDLRFGDIILLTTDSEYLVHSCVYIADDIVFTKNGDSRMRPWKLDTLANVREVYFRASIMLVARRNEGAEMPGVAP